MKLFHLADLHIGKTLCGFELYEDLKHVLAQVLELIREHRPQGLILAGDIYDRRSPQARAVSLFDWFLTAAAEITPHVFIISGNHDSPERLDFAGGIMRKFNIHVYGEYDGAARRVELEDEFGEIVVHLLPFIRPSTVRRFVPDGIESYEDALRAALPSPRPGARNVLIAHQFVWGHEEPPERRDSERVAVGGVDRVPVELFSGFDYVALGHLHGALDVAENIRYCGSPLKYSFSEFRDVKSVTLAELGAPGSLAIERLELTPLRDMRKIRGDFESLTRPEIVNAENPEDYLHITLTDQNEVVSSMDKLRAHYPNIMQLCFDNRRSASVFNPGPADSAMSPLELFCKFYAEQNGDVPTPGQIAALREIFAGGEL